MKRDSDLICRVDVTPLLAVMLVLLSIFEVTTSSLQGPRKALELFQAQSAVLQPGAMKDDALRVSVDRGGNVFFNSTRVSPDELHDAIQQGLHATPMAVVYVVVDRRSWYLDVKPALEVIQRAGARRVSFLTE
jgi:biopolymer transport protein ExbD